MSVLVTIMKNSMQNRAGYVKLSDLDMMETYTFNKCIKIKKSPFNDKITKWINFYEGLDLAVVFKVAQAKNEVTGEVVLFILSYEVKSTSEVGNYNSERANLNYYYGTVYGGVLMSKEDLVRKCRADIANSSAQMANDNYSPEIIKEAKSSESTTKPKKFKADLNLMTPERKAELLKQIFG